MNDDTMDADDFPYSFRWEMVRAYPVISGVPDAREADRVDINAGFLKIMLNRHMTRTLQAYLDDRPPSIHLCPDCDCVRDKGHDGRHYNIAGQPI